MAEHEKLVVFGMAVCYLLSGYFWHIAGAIHGRADERRRLRRALLDPIVRDGEVGVGALEVLVDYAEDRHGSDPDPGGREVCAAAERGRVVLDVLRGKDGG